MNKQAIATSSPIVNLFTDTFFMDAFMAIEADLPTVMVDPEYQQEINEDAQQPILLTMDMQKHTFCELDSWIMGDLEMEDLIANTSAVMGTLSTRPGCRGLHTVVIENNPIDKEVPACTPTLQEQDIDLFLCGHLPMEEVFKGAQEYRTAKYRMAKPVISQITSFFGSVCR